MRLANESRRAADKVDLALRGTIYFGSVERKPMLLAFKFARSERIGGIEPASRRRGREFPSRPSNIIRCNRKTKRAWYVAAGGVKYRFPL